MADWLADWEAREDEGMSSLRFPVSVPVRTRHYHPRREDPPTARSPSTHTLDGLGVAPLVPREMNHLQKLKGLPPGVRGGKRKRYNYKIGAHSVDQRTAVRN